MARDNCAGAWLASMTAAVAHRGPDGQSQWLGPNVGLGHTRLAIIDLAGGDQPMCSADGHRTIVFNGEIYNYAELKDQLVKLGYRFKTRSDTEVIWAAVDAWGIEQGLLKLRGMFAFALYDARDRSLLLARDRAGIKPLYFGRLAGGIAFASEQKALLTLPMMPRRVNPTAIHDYLGAGYATAPATCWADIDVLEPGCWLKIEPSRESSGRYWKWMPRERAGISIEDATERVDATLRESLRYHMISDVPVGAFLSGGLDSSLMTALLSGAQSRPKTYSVGFGDPQFDETPYAREVAEKFHTEHHEIQIDGNAGDPDLFQAIVQQYDEPFGDSSCIPVYMICREMRQRLKVVLSGDGGDEVLGGYTRYVHARKLASLARLNGFLPRLRPFASFAEEHLGRRGYQAAKAWRFAQLPVPERLSALLSYFPEQERIAMYQPDFASRAASEGTTAARFSRFLPAGVTDPIQQIISAEVGLRLHADYLRKVDVASSAHGLEVRVPYLDSEMLDLAAELPVNYKVAPGNGGTKVLSRRLAEKYLPPGFSQRRKQGFSIPLDRWSGPGMRRFFQELLLDPKSRIAEMIRPQALKQVWETFEGGGPDAGLSRFQRYQQLFLVVSLELWLRRWSPAL
jgi:asparagine synthase (glutamine-hydrolysing)